MLYRKATSRTWCNVNEKCIRQMKETIYRLLNLTEWIIYSYRHSRELTHERCVNWPVTSLSSNPVILQPHLLVHLFAKPKMRPLKFNKCLSKRESERMCKRNQLTSNLYYVRDATDPSGKRGARGQWIGGGRGRGNRVGRSASREWWGIAASCGFGSLRPVSAASGILVSPAAA